jgi:hypothetical protein
LNKTASENIKLAADTFDTFHCDKSALKTDAPENFLKTKEQTARVSTLNMGK